jgi:hypothetical protein
MRPDQTGQSSTRDYVSGGILPRPTILTVHFIHLPLFPLQRRNMFGCKEASTLGQLYLYDIQRSPPINRGN